MKSWQGLLAALALAALFGCSGGTTGQKEGTNAPPAGASSGAEFKVALLTPGPVSDSGWSAMAYGGLQAIQTELGATVNNQEATGPKIRDAMRTYAQQGYRLVFGHGFEYNQPAIEVAKDFPNTIFISSSGAKTAANVGAFRFYLEQGFYLAGMMGALMSKTGSVAMIGGDNVPSIKSTFKGFRAGAETARPGIKIIEVFTGNGTDIAAAKSATLQAIAQGADFVIHQANAAAQGVFEACKEKSVYAFGANLNQNDNPSGIVIASAVIDAKPAFLSLARRVKEGTFKGEVVLMGMNDKAIDFVVNPALQAKVPADVLAKVLEARSKIESGELVVPKDEF